MSSGPASTGPATATRPPADDPLAGDSEADRVLRRWGWPYQPPLTERGRRYACRIAVGLSRVIEKPNLEGVHPRLEYLAKALAVGRGLLPEPWPRWPGDPPANSIATGRPAICGRFGGWRQARGGLSGLRAERVPASRGFYVASSTALSLLLGASLLTSLIGGGDLGVPWSSVAITAWFFTGVIVGFISSLREPKDWQTTLFFIGAGGLTPTFFISISAAHAIDKFILFRSLLSQGRFFNAIPVALLIVTPAGNPTHLLLGLLAITGLLIAYQVGQTVTHPALPSSATATLVKWLHPFRPDPPASPDRPPAAAPKSAPAR